MGARRHTGRLRAGAAHARARTLASLLAISSAACMVGPDYQRPEVALPTSYLADGGAQAELVGWWRGFDDATLVSLVERAQAANLDLREADARMREARAERRVARAPLFPSLDASGSYRRIGSSGAAREASGASASGDSRDQYELALDALFEIDLFGGNRRAAEAADALVELSIEERRAVLVLLIGDVAASYVEMRSLQSELEVTQRNLEAQRSTLEVTEARSRAGLTSDLDVAGARAQAETTAAELYSLEAAARATMYRLGVLLGSNPGDLLAELSPPAPVPTAPESIALGVPADLLRRRPDVRSAERELAAATATVGEATADLYPRLELLGTIGFRAENTSDLLSRSAVFGAWGPSVSWPIFAGGSIRGNIEATDARREQAALAYERTVRTALQEAESAYARWTLERDRSAVLVEAATASRRAADLARRLHAAGLEDFLTVLTAQRAQLDAERRLSTSTAAIATDAIALYVALGGGWETSP